jgi:lysozyme family protein
MRQDKIIEIIERLVVSEGNTLTNDKDDPGKLTYCGISFEFNPKWEGWKLLKSLQKKYPEELIYPNMQESVFAFYIKEYWDKMGLGGLDSPEIAETMLHLGVNCGRYQAGKIFQASINTMGYNLKEDGWIGNKTISAANQINVIKTIGDSEDLQMIIAHNAMSFWLSISQPKYLYGRFRRLRKLLMLMK